MKLRWTFLRNPVFIVGMILAPFAALAVTLTLRLGTGRVSDSLPIQQIATKIDDAVFSNRQSRLQSLTRIEEILRVATGEDQPDNAKITVVLNTAKRIFDADLVYIMNKDGLVVSCTRMEDGSTLTGRSYAFRPYFKAALRGEDAVYPALGVTTGLRGMYFSTPILGPDRRIQGIVVVKVGMDSIDAILAEHPTPICLVSPDGIIFATNRKELLYRYVKPLKAEELEAIKASQQFANVELKPSQILRKGGNTAEYNDERYFVSDRPILTNWSIVALMKGGPNYVINKHIVFTMIGLFVLMAGIIAVMAYVIHARKRAESALRESENSLRKSNDIQSLILGNSTVGIAFVKNRAFEWVNPRMGEIFGLPVTQIQEASTRIVYASEEEFERIGRIAYPALSRGERFEVETRTRRADGSPFWAQIIGKALDPACPDEGSIWIYEDITERKQSEEELKIHRENLEELVGRRTAELREAKEQAEEATKAKSIFLASMSHELRTPLNAILGYAQLLAHTAADAESRDNLQRIHRAGEHLLGLINHVLSLAKIEAGKLSLDLQPFPTEAFFRTIEDMTRTRAQAKGLAFRLEVGKPFPESLVGDSLKLRQVLVNLLGNAIKFTQQGSVSLEVAREGDRVCFAVRDTGPGMSPEEVANLFHAFYQTSSGRQAIEGTGLGLHISQAMVHLMGGSIEVETQEGHGSLFRFEIPLSEAQPAAPEVASVFGLAPGQAAQRMLVVDDIEDNRTLLARMFTAMGLEVREAEDGLAALRAWEAWQPHAVWMDLKMPRMDGFEAVKRLRAREKELARPRAVVIALTASVLDLEIGPIREIGFDDLISKPFPESELLEKLHHYCGLELLREAPPAEGISEGELANRVAELSPDWIKAFDKALLLGDREEALELVGALQDRSLTDHFLAQLKEFRFEALRALIASREIP